MGLTATAYRNSAVAAMGTVGILKHQRNTLLTMLAFSRLERKLNDSLTTGFEPNGSPPERPPWNEAPPTARLGYTLLETRC